MGLIWRRRVTACERSRPSSRSKPLRTTRCPADPLRSTLCGVSVDNREISNRNYSASQLDLVADDAVNQNLIALRLDYVRRLGAGKDVLDLCCGTGSYLLPALGQMRSAVAVDFSSTMLDGLRDRLGG